MSLNCGGESWDAVEWGCVWKEASQDRGEKWLISDKSEEERWSMYEQKKLYRRNSEISEQVKRKIKLIMMKWFKRIDKLRSREELEQWQENCWCGNDTDRRKLKEEYL